MKKVREALFSGRQKRATVIAVIAGVILALAIGLWLTRNEAKDLWLSRQPTRTWYVATTGEDSADGTSETTPITSIQQALDYAKPGDTVKIADGEYKQSFSSVRDGTKKRPITIEGSRKAIIYGSGSRIIEINHSFLQLKGFSVNGKSGDGTKKSDYKDKLIYVIGKEKNNGVHGLLLTDLSLENAGGECLRLRYQAHDNEVSKSIIKNCGVYDFKFSDGGKNGEGIYVGTAPEQLSDGKNPTNGRDTSNNNWIHDNQIETYGNECVDIKESAHDNLVENNSCSHQMDSESGGLDARGSNNTFRGNKVFNNKGAGVRLGGDEDDDGINNNVYDNEIFDNEGTALKITREPQGKICGNDVNNNKDDETSAANNCE